MRCDGLFFPQDPPSADSTRQKRFGPLAPPGSVKTSGEPVPTWVSTFCQATKSVVDPRRYDQLGSDGMVMMASLVLAGDGWLGRMDKFRI